MRMVGSGRSFASLDGWYARWRHWFVRFGLGVGVGLERSEVLPFAIILFAGKKKISFAVREKTPCRLAKLSDHGCFCGLGCGYCRDESWVYEGCMNYE